MPPWPSEHKRIPRFRATQLLDRVPEEREKPVVTYKNLSIKVLHVQERWISKVLIHVMPEPSPEEKEEKEKDEE